MSASSLLAAGEAAAVSLTASAPPVEHGIVSRALLATPELRVVLFNFSAGQSLTEHTSTSRALIQVLAGACEFSVAGVPRTLRAGDLLHLPPNVPHALEATEPLTMLLTLGAAPKKARAA